MGTEQKKIAAQNKKAFHDYFVLDRYEAGIELCGTEVKSIRQGKLNLKDSCCSSTECTSAHMSTAISSTATR